MKKTDELYEMTISEASSMLAKKEISSVELTSSVIARIEQVESKVKGFLYINKEDAIQSAENADKRIKTGDFTPMTRLEILIKKLNLAKKLEIVLECPFQLKIICVLPEFRQHVLLKYWRILFLLILRPQFRSY